MAAEAALRANPKTHAKLSFTLKEETTMGFWVQFAIQEALSVVAAFIQSTPALTPAQKAAGEQLLIAGEQFVASFAKPTAPQPSTPPAQ